MSLNWRRWKMSDHPQRKQFESWITSPPFEKDISRFLNDPIKYAWPGNYRDLEVELAWEAWQEASKNREMLEELLADLYHNYSLTTAAMKRIHEVLPQGDGPVE
jgi:hypothetical protein